MHYKFIVVVLLGMFTEYVTAQTTISDSSAIAVEVPFASTDTLKSFLVKKNPPFIYTPNFKHAQKSTFNKIVRGTVFITGFNVTMGGYLAVAPEYVSKWNKAEKFKLHNIIAQYHESFTKPPVIDHDLFIVNYIGHPYQGGFYYNTVRSQGANVWQSSAFCVAQSLLWEYGWEAGMEQPSIQDLISTPFVGIIVGELSHVATIKMSRNGFRWYEKVLVCIVNPSYAINNGFKTSGLSLASR